MKLKPGVKIHGIQPEIVLALMVAESIYKKHNEECTVTSVRDGKHGDNSFHYLGLAADLRTRDLTASPTLIAGEIKEALGSDFDVVAERDHIHIEYDEKTT